MQERNKIRRYIQNSIEKFETHHYLLDRKR